MYGIAVDRTVCEQSTSDLLYAIRVALVRDLESLSPYFLCLNCRLKYVVMSVEILKAIRL